jgi:tryptophan synthase beta chain
MTSKTNLQAQDGPYFGEYGGRFVPESLIAALDQLEETYAKAKADPTLEAFTFHK